MDWQKEILEAVKRAKEAAYQTPNYTTEQKNIFLSRLAENLSSQRTEIINANSADIEDAIAHNQSKAFLDRLRLTDERIDKMLVSLAVVKQLSDPVGKKIWETERPNGLRIERVRTPIGVIGIIYESRPDVTVEASILGVKAGNCVVLRGGKEAINSNKILVSILKKSLKEARLSEDTINLISVGGRESVKYVLSLSRYIDLIIPRGGDALIQAVVEHSCIPVIKHYKGICHTYIDKDADVEMALKVAFNAKVQRPSTCNATETLLVHKNIAKAFIPRIGKLFKKAGVEMRGCEETKKLLPDIKGASEKDWKTEYLDLVISIRVVNTLEDAISHINRYGTLHTEAIITDRKETADIFLKSIDAAAVFHNTSTRFTDGGEFGLGAEIGISTDKIHARGPMGLEELTTYKYVIHGDGQIRE